MKRFFRKIHLWLSVPFGIVITLVCFSGAMLVFEKELTRLFGEDIYKVEKAAGDPCLSIPSRQSWRERCPRGCALRALLSAVTLRRLIR